MKKIFNICLIILFYNTGFAQDFIFFNDSPNSNYYDPSWGFANTPSTLEIINGTKFPVSTQYFFSGNNSLKLNWTSQPGGDWGMAVAEPGWPGHDINLKDSIYFFVYSATGIDSSFLPKIYLEDLNNQKTARFSLSDYSSDIPANIWTRIFVPLSIFKNNPGNADITQIKTIFFGQDLADGNNHILYLDEIRMTGTSGGGNNPPAVPKSVQAKGFDMHIDVTWEMNSESDLSGYYIYKLIDTTYVRVGTVDKTVNFYTDFFGAHNVTHSYKVSAFDAGLNESGLSAGVSATTYRMNDEELLDMVQEATFRYFWDYAHPVSGLSRERLGSKNTVTSGGSGFGVMAILVGIERGFITREQGVQRMLKILNFLNTKADRFHGAFSHWLNGETGKVIPFSPKDDGGDLVETSFMIQGLLAARQYFNLNNTDEEEIRNTITSIWETVEWSWYKQFPDSPWLYWHWSPNYGWEMNHWLRGYNEVMITYLLAIASPAFSVSPLLYYTGWAGGNYENGNSYYGIPLFVGQPYGGPLFFAHYSYLGFDPRNKKERYANYFFQNRNHTLINRAHCIANPNGFVGYDENTWGLTASDNSTGYSAHSPTNDNGTITPTAGLSSMPYTPVESMALLKNLYRNYGENLWSVFGFKDAFNPTQNWFANSYLAIDQGPIIIMIENYRSQLLWNMFMANPEIQPMLNAIEFEDDPTHVDDRQDLPEQFVLYDNYPNPFNPSTTIRFVITSLSFVEVEIYSLIGEKVNILISEDLSAGVHNILWNGKNESGKSVSSGVYFYTVNVDGKIHSKKMILQK